MYRTKSRISLGLLLISTLALSCLSSSIFKQQDGALAQQYIQTIKHRDLVIDLGNGLKTNARLNLPAVGEGPFPAVLLVHGSGPVDMNETTGYVRIDNETGSKIYPPSRPFFQIAKYLSERGFAVLQYDKRGVGQNFTIDTNVWGNVTFNDLKQDAEKALGVLIEQPEVDASRITVLGHSEGTMIVPRIAIDNPNKVDNIVLMGAIAQTMNEIGYFQGVTLPVLYAQQVLDHNHNGLISVQEASEDPVFRSILNLTLLLTQNNTNVDSTAEQQLQYDVNNDTFITIYDELKPRLMDWVYKSLSVVTPGEKCTGKTGPCPIWISSYASLIPTLDTIGKVPSDTSILIQQGENDSQTPIQEAFLLQQKLTEIRHPDHTLITYPNLGHVFYPSSQWLTAFGPIKQGVLADLYAWLEAHSGLSQAYLTPTTASTMGANTSSLNTNKTSP